MLRFRSLWIAVAAVVIAVPAMAGEKCTSSTQECLDYMSHQMKDSGWVGIELDTKDEMMVITKVVPSSPAETAGMQPGDALIAMYGIEFSEANQEKLKTARKEWKPGQAVEYTVKRDGVDRKINLTLANMPADVLAQWIGRHMMEHATVETADATKENSDG